MNRSWATKTPNTPLARMKRKAKNCVGGHQYPRNQYAGEHHHPSQQHERGIHPVHGSIIRDSQLRHPVIFLHKLVAPQSCIIVEVHPG
jgi:hypothetical protein